MRQLTTLVLLTLLVSSGFSQDNPVFSDPVMESVILGQFDPAQYDDPTAIHEPALIFDDLVNSLSADSLRVHLMELMRFHNRNSGADTVSRDSGIGAARHYLYSKLEAYGRAQNGQLLTGYYQFDRDICGVTRHKNVLAVLPGVGEHFDEFILVEAHFDSRCEDRCGIDCAADGADDNGSGSALVMELARVMSQYRFDRSIIFMLTTGEEQGLVGARSFAEYARDNDVNIVAVYNNDVVGGVICGETASPPGCPGLNEIDSVNVRIYSEGSGASRNKGLARYLKLQYQEEMFDRVPNPSAIQLMSAEDRTGRGGDHIPFREQGFAAVRLTEANEHGNGNPSTPGYSDRQHTSTDVIGRDTTGDGIIDEYFVDFNYLRKNALINATAIVSAASGPETPQLVEWKEVPGGIALQINDPMPAPAYRFGLRKLSSGPDFDTIYTIHSTVDTIWDIPRFFYYVSLASVDDRGIESLFTIEERLSVPSGTKDVQGGEDQPLIWELMQNSPNPFDETTWIKIIRHKPVPVTRAWLSITDMSGAELTRIPVELRGDVTEVLYDYAHHQFQPGVYAYSLVIDGVLVDTKRMIYAY